VWFVEHESEFEHLPWPAWSDLNIFKPLWGILEEQVRQCFPPPTSHSDLTLEKEWLKIPLVTLKDLYVSVIPKMN